MHYGVCENGECRRVKALSDDLPAARQDFFSFFSQVVHDFLTALMCSVSSRTNLLEKDYHNLKGLINNPLKMHETHQIC